MPWNFPLWQAMRFAAPALMAGNVGLLKHASNVPQTALFMQDLFARAGFPEGTFQTLLVGSARVEAILRDERVMAATLTGSGPAGQSVAAIAGSEIKKVVLELGGSDPFIVMPSADLGRPRPRWPPCARVPEQRPVLHRGQALHRARRRLRRVRAPVRRADGGPRRSATRWPTAPTWARWPPSSSATTSRSSSPTRWPRGAKVLCGGAAPDRPGFYYPPTVLTGITPDMRVHSEEVFGPVATLYRVDDIDAAIELANGTEFGLGANAWTNDEAERSRFIRDLAAGMVFINGNVTSYPQLPFGGVKSSGHGRELSAHGIREFCNIKSGLGRPARPADQPTPGDRAAHPRCVPVSLHGPSPAG